MYQGLGGAVLLARYLSERSSVALHFRKTDCLVEHMRRDSVRVRDISDAHPGAGGFSFVVMPVDGPAHCPHEEKSRYDDSHQKKRQQEPLTPSELSHLKILRHKRDAKTKQRPIRLQLDFIDVRKISGRIRADGITGRVTLLVTIKTQLERFRLAPLFVKDVADEIEDDGRTNGQTITCWHYFARAPIFADDTNEFAQRKVVVIVARGVGHACAPDIKGERINARIETIKCSVELAIARQVTRLQRCLNADDLPLMFPVPFDKNIAIAGSVLSGRCESARSHRVETRHVSIVHGHSLIGRNDVPLDIEARQLFDDLRAQLRLFGVRREKLRATFELESFAKLFCSLIKPSVHFCFIPPLSCYI